jgi:predicted nucleic acid-binding protein
MPEPPVVNASPLIVLSRARMLDLLLLLGDHVIVPEVVAGEVSAHSDEAARALVDLAWLRRVPAAPVSPPVAAWDLGGGESAVLSGALVHPGSLAVIDDYAARTCAEAFGIPVVGTLGLALRAKVRRRVPAARPLVEEMRRAGLYLSDALVQQVLALVGE